MKVLFVCVENSCRSQMAEAWFNALAMKAAMKAAASSAGTKPADDIDPLAVKVMEEVGISMKNQKPKALTPEMVKEFDLIVTMGCIDSCPYSPGKTIEWNIEDPKGKGIEKYREVRDTIKREVENLIRNLLLKCSKKEQ